MSTHRSPEPDADHGGADRKRDAATIAREVVRHFQATDAALSSVIGHRGVVALYERTLHLASRIHPWLPGTTEDEQSEIDLGGLEVLVGQQSAEAAEAAAASLIKGFHDLLASLVGASLTEQLLHPPLTPPPVRENPR